MYLCLTAGLLKWMYSPVVSVLPREQAGHQSDILLVFKHLTKYIPTGPLSGCVHAQEEVACWTMVGFQTRAWTQPIRTRVERCLFTIIYTLHVCNQRKQTGCSHGNDCAITQAQCFIWHPMLQRWVWFWLCWAWLSVMSQNRACSRSF